MDACPNCTHATLHPQGMCLKDGCDCTSDVPMDPVDAVIQAAKASPPKEKSYSYKIWYVGGGTTTFDVKANEWRDSERKVQHNPAVSTSEHFVTLTQVNGIVSIIPWTSIMQLDRLPDPKSDEVEKLMLDDL